MQKRRLSNTKHEIDKVPIGAARRSAHAPLTSPLRVAPIFNIRIGEPVVRMNATPSASIALGHVSQTLLRYRYRYTRERQLHDAIETALAQNGIDFQREYMLDARNRLDFWLPEHHLAIEVKVDGSAGAALRQCLRYLDEGPDVIGVVLATTCPWAATMAHSPLSRIFVARLARQAL